MINFKCDCGCTQLQKIEVACTISSIVSIGTDGNSISEISSSEPEMLDSTFSHYECFNCNKYFSDSDLIVMCDNESRTLSSDLIVMCDNESRTLSKEFIKKYRGGIDYQITHYKFQIK